MDDDASTTRPESQSKDAKTIVSLYSNYLTDRVLGLLSSIDSSTFLSKLTGFLRQTARSRSRRSRPFLPLPLPNHSLFSFPPKTEASSVVDVLEDVVGQIYSNLHDIEKNLQFWQSKAEGTTSEKAYFMLFERGPRALFDETVQLIRGSDAEGSRIQHLCHTASAQISARIAVLSSLRCCLATFLAQLSDDEIESLATEFSKYVFKYDAFICLQTFPKHIKLSLEVYVEVGQYEEDFENEPDKALLSLLAVVNALFFKLEKPLEHLHEIHQIDSPMDPNNLFEKLPEVNKEESQWTDREINDAIKLVYQNLDKLESYITLTVAKHRKPRKVARYWIRYTCGAVGLSVCSIWLLKHSSLMGSPDINNWIGEAKTSTIVFFNEHVEQPLLSIRDELFETFRKRHKGMMDLEEVHLTSNSLHRMLLAFTEQVKGKNIPENGSDLEMLEIVMARYEKELMHPIQNLLNGELARALLIQVQKLKLDIETAMLELNQILRANEINFAILAALPAFFLTFGLLMLLRKWFKQDTRAEGRGRISRIQRRLLVVEVEKRIMSYQTFMDSGLEADAQCMSGLLLYSLDRLYCAVERHAKASGEWQCLKQDIVDLAKPDLQTANKLIVTSRLGRMYDCLLPPLKRQ